MAPEILHSTRYCPSCWWDHASRSRATVYVRDPPVRDVWAVKNGAAAINSLEHPKAALENRF